MASLTKEWDLKVGNKTNDSQLFAANDPDIFKTPYQIAATTHSRC